MAFPPAPPLQGPGVRAPRRPRPQADANNNPVIFLPKFPFACSDPQADSWPTSLTMNAKKRARIASGCLWGRWPAAGRECLLLAVACAISLFGVGVRDVSGSVLVEDAFAGAAGATPDAAKFVWDGEVTQNGAGLLILDTNWVNRSWLRSSAGAAPAPGETLVLQFRARAYAESGSPGIYGDGQPRGLRVGTDANNCVEFYSISRTSLGLRLRSNGVESSGSYPVPSGVDAAHDYEIAVGPASVTFKVDGATAGTFATNIPTGILNAHLATYDGYAGQVPVYLDSLSLCLEGATGPDAPVISGFSPAGGLPGTIVTLSGANLGGITSVQFNGVSAMFASNSASELTATVPAGATSGVITVTGPGGTATSPGAFSVHTLVSACTEGDLASALSGGFGKVIFACDGVIDLAATQVVSSDVTLDASGHSVTLHGGGAVRVLAVDPGVRLTLLNLRITGGGGVASGGGIHNAGGVVEATDCTFADNSATGEAGGGNGFGGAIYNDGGSLVLTNCTFTNNNATGGTGSTGSYSAGVGGAGGNGYGGAILGSGGSIVLTNCTFHANHAAGGAGGSGGPGYDGYTYWVSGPFGSGHLVTVPGGPGGKGGDGGNGFGGGLHTSSGCTVTMVNVTLASGTAGGGAGGIPGPAGAYGSGDGGSGSPGSSSLGGNLAVTSGTATLRNTIVAYGSGTPGHNCSGTLVDGGNNICSDTTAGLSAAGSLNNIDPVLAPSLAPNGGPTMTLALLRHSPAVDGGDDTGAPVADQRHLPRIGRCDIGAFELQRPLISGFAPGSGLAGTSVTIDGTNFFAVTAVTFGGVEASYTLESASRITATVPAAAATGPISVVCSNGTASGPAPFLVGSPEFTYEILGAGQDARAVITGYTGSGGAVSIPNTIAGLPVTAVLDGAFLNCNELTAVTLGDHVVFVGESAFNGCTNLAAIGATDANPNFSSEDGVLFNKSKTTLVLCPPTKAGFYEIPDGVTSLANSAFRGCGDLAGVTVPASLAAIGDNAFLGCGGLTGAVFWGNAPSAVSPSVFSSAAPAFSVYYFAGASDFTSPTWFGYPSVKMGTYSPIAPWLIANGFAHDTDLSSTPNHDGVSLLMSYALGLDPSRPQAGHLPKASIVGGQLRLPLRVGSAGVTYWVEASHDLQNWTTEGVAISAPDADGFCTASTPWTGACCFLRVRVAY